MTTPDGQYLVPRALATQIEMSLDLAMDRGLILDTREHVPPSRRTRLRWKLGDLRGSAAERAYRLIAGHDVPEQDW